MDRNSRNRPGDGSDGSPPSAAWLFAQAVLGKPISRIINPEVEANAKCQQLERLARISPRHAEELSRLRGDEAEGRRQRELLEWLAKISTEHEIKLRRLLSEEAEAREGWQCAAEYTEMLLEGNWDSTKHHRRTQGTA